jgi:hypothetical protein
MPHDSLANFNTCTPIFVNVAFQALHGIIIEQLTPHRRLTVKVTRKNQRLSAIRHGLEKIFIVTRETQFLSQKRNSHQSLVATMNQVTSAAGEIKLPVNRIFRR